MKKIASVLVFVCCLGLIAPLVTVAADKPAADAAGMTDRVNVNTASTAELTALPGVGERTAERIVQFRNEHGAFVSIDDLVKVKGIGTKTLEKIRPMVVL